MGKFIFEIEKKTSGNAVYKLIIEIKNPFLIYKDKKENEKLESFEYTVNDVLKSNAKVKIIKIERPTKVKTLVEWKVHIGKHVLLENIKPYLLPRYVYTYWKENMFLDDDEDD
jgi:hypothetical protein